MTGAAPVVPTTPRELSGPVDVCVDVPRLELDRPFTYLLPEGTGAGVGSLVSVPFHGRTLRGWVLGAAAEVPDGRLLPVRKVRSDVRFFDERMLAVLRAVGERYLAPLCTVIDRSHPPRVAGEEGVAAVLAAAVVQRVPPRRARWARDGASPQDVPTPPPGDVSWHRPLPGREADDCVHAVRSCLDSGGQAIVLVPEADPLPRTGAAVLEAFGERAVAFLGPEPRERYRTWLRILAGGHDVVVGTRPAVFAPLADLGLLWVSRECHPGHREERSPYYHVRDVAAIRAGVEGAVCVLASYSPSVDTAAAVASGSVRSVRPPRDVERAAAPLVETVVPDAADRSPRLGSLLRRARSAALVVSRRGYGLARVCRTCGRPAGCAACGGALVAEGGRLRCRACGAEAMCGNCGSVSFGVERRGTEHIAEWASRLASVPVELSEREDGSGHPPSPDRVTVGTAAAVKDVGDLRLDLVAILDPDRALARPGLHAGEQAVATWMEAAAWAGPRADGGRVLAHTRQPGSPAIQALVRWEPSRFLEAEGLRRTDAGFPPNHPVFRVEGPPGPDLEAALRVLRPVSLLVTTGVGGIGTVCLVTVRPEDLPGFRAEVLRLAAVDTVTRVEAEPHL